MPTFDLATLESTARSLYPGVSIEDALARAGTVALLSADEIAAVAASTGDLRKSWLLRDTAIGFTVQEPIVPRECVDDTRSWCFGTGWTASELYAPDQPGAMQSIADIRAMFDMLAP